MKVHANDYVRTEEQEYKEMEVVEEASLNVIFDLDLSNYLSKPSNVLKLVPLEMTIEEIALAIHAGIDDARNSGKKPIIRLIGDNEELCDLLIDKFKLPEHLFVDYPKDYQDFLFNKKQKCGEVICINVKDGEIISAFELRLC